MKKINFLIIGVLASGSMLSPMESRGQPLSAPIEQLDPRYNEAEYNAKALISNVSMALLAIDYGKLEAAERYLGSAEEKSLGFEDNGKPFHAIEAVRFNKLSYDVLLTDKKYKRPHYALIPFEEGNMLPSWMNGTKMGIRRRDATLIYLDIALDSQKISADLKQVRQSLAVQDKARASELLGQILTSDIGTEASEKPGALQASYDHVLLAQHLLKQKEYKYSRMALTHASKELFRYSVHNPDSRREEQVQVLTDEMNRLIEMLKKEDPSVLQKAENKMKAWLKTLEGWIAEHAKLKRKPG